MNVHGRWSIYRHGALVRVTHWISAVCLAGLLMSGLQIFNAHPALYWGQASDFDRPLLSIETQPVAFPGWITVPEYRDLATGRRWHFFLAWLLVLNGAVYLISGFFSGHFRRDLLPDREQLRHIGRSIIDHLRLRFPKGEEAKRYNVLQKLSYLFLIFVLLPVMVLAGRRRESHRALLPDPRPDGSAVGRMEQHPFHDHRPLRAPRPCRRAGSRFKVNGSDHGAGESYEAHANQGFADWRLEVGGLVERPVKLSLAELRALPSRTQITRHDCVEGWSCIGKWKGVPLGVLLERVGLRSGARYIAFHCADRLEEPGPNYYESIDLVDAFHPQTILAYEMNDQALPVPHGAPLRLRVERQLGYKMAKFVMRVEAVESFARLGAGKGGYWEDRGYDWYAGI